MNLKKRAMLYLLRKRGKTISIFILVLVVATFLISSFSILNASENLSRDIRTSLGAAFYLRANTAVSVDENGESTITENHINVSENDIKSIMNCGEIKYYNPINYGFAKSDEISFIPGKGDSKESNMGKVTAFSYSALATDFTDEVLTLTEGKHITVSDKKQILISEQLAQLNHLSVGDTVTLTHAKLVEENGEYADEIKEKTAFCTVTVSGIYKLNLEDTSITPTAGVAENQIYASSDVLNELAESKSGVYTGEVDFYITDPAKLSQTVANVQQLQIIDWTTHFIRINDFQYSKISDQLSSLGNLIKILLVCVSIVSTAVLTLLLTMRIRSRLQEAGVLLAAGISKHEIVGQFLLEVLSVTIAAFFVSYAASCCLTHTIDSSLFAGINPNLINEQTLQRGLNTTVKMVSYLNLPAIKVVVIYLCQLAVVAASTFVSSIMIMRLKPKEILSKMS